MHKSVLLQESIDALDLAPGKVFLDGTYGAGGHTHEVLQRFGESVRVVALDQDPEVRNRAKDQGVEVTTESFRNVDRVMESLDVRPDAILLDIGISSDQIDTSNRGFSFQRDEPLDMRMSQDGPTAADILNSWDEHAIELILRGFGEERFSKRIANAIVARRELKPFETTTHLTELLEEVLPANYERGRINKATRTFQALRIAVNGELAALEEGLAKGWDVLAPGGRMAVITFHSLEDRIVKNFFRDKVKEEKGELIYKKPLTPSEEEIATNPRSRSAKLRVIKKIND